MLDRKTCADCRDEVWGGRRDILVGAGHISWYCPAKEDDRRLPVVIGINEVPPPRCTKKLEHAIAEGMTVNVDKKKNTDD